MVDRQQRQQHLIVDGQAALADEQQTAAAMSDGEQPAVAAALANEE